MKTLFYSTKDFEQSFLETANLEKRNIKFTSERLSPQTVNLAEGYEVVSIFTGDDASAPVLNELFETGVRFIAIRAAGYDNVDIDHATKLGMAIGNVPEYSPYAIAEHAVALILALNRKIILANRQVHAHNFTTSNLIGFDLHGKTVGIIGAGKIGTVFAKIMHGFGCRILVYDILENVEAKEKYNLEYVELPVLCREANIISVHTCLTPATRHILDKQVISLMRPGVMIINTSRGACVNTSDIITGLASGLIGYYGADVYEKESGLFFHDHSGKKLQDEMLEKLLAMPNVLITPHQAFATEEALTNIATTTFENIFCWEKGEHSQNELTPHKEVKKDKNPGNVYFQN